MTSPPPRPSQQFFGIPELVTHLGSLIDKPVLLLLMKTRKSVFEMLTPTYWLNVDVENEYQTKSLFSSEGAIEAFKDNAQEIRSLKAGFAFLSFYFGTNTQQGIEEIVSPIRYQIMVNLTELDVSLKRITLFNNEEPFLACLNHTPIPLLNFFCFLNSHENLTVVNLRDLPSLSEARLHTLCLAISSLQKLSHLTIHLTENEDYPDSILPLLFFHCPKSLVSFKLIAVLQENQIGGAEEVTRNDIAGSNSLRQEPLSNLKALVLPRCDAAYTANQLCRILEHCPALEELDVPDIKDTEIKRIIETFQSHLQQPSIAGESSNTLNKPDNTLLHLTSIHPGRDRKGEATASIMKMMKKNMLRSLTFYHFDDLTVANTGVYGSFIESMRNHNCSLVAINFMDLDRIQSTSIMRIMEECTALESLVLTCKDTMRACLKLEDATAFSWECKKLKELRLSVDLRLRGNMDHSLISEFYTALGNLVHLEVLDLKLARPSPQIDGLSYTETTMPDMISIKYLEKFSKLKNLRVLLGSFLIKNPDMKKMLGEAEVDWILENWPRLKVFELQIDNELDGIRSRHLDKLKGRKLDFKRPQRYHESFDVDTAGD
ncbi:hypothetical protein FBU30_005516 [Linnemannia zychae]|nr:hypothetical protein FBU30_005516 [Linnemannia zychae]